MELEGVVLLESTATLTKPYTVGHGNSCSQSLVAVNEGATNLFIKRERMLMPAGKKNPTMEVHRGNYNPVWISHQIGQGQVTTANQDCPCSPRPCTHFELRNEKRKSSQSSYIWNAN